MRCACLESVVVSQFQHVYVVTNHIMCVDKFRLFVDSILVLIFSACVCVCAIVIKQYLLRITLFCSIDDVYWADFIFFFFLNFVCIRFVCFRFACTRIDGIISQTQNDLSDFDASGTMYKALHTSTWLYGFVCYNYEIRRLRLTIENAPDDEFSVPFYRTFVFHLLFRSFFLQ